MPQTPEELEIMLHKGMGRAVLYMLSQDLSQYREMILDNCLHNYAYDKQCEDTRAEYLHSLIQRSGQEEYYRTEILKALIATEDSWDAGQLLDFTVIFARNGDERARQAIYERLEHDAASPELPGAYEAIELDGAHGLVGVLRVIGATGTTHGTTHVDLLVEDAIKLSGADAVRRSVREAAANDKNVAAALSSMGYSLGLVVEEASQRLQESRATVRRRSEELYENTMWREIKNRRDFKIVASRWAKVASQAELTEAANDLNPQDEPSRLQSHLRMFYRHPFPSAPEPLVRLVDHPNSSVALAALVALQNVCHEAVRRLFDQLRVDRMWSDRAVGLLRSNYRDGDEHIIADMLERETDAERLHSIAMDTENVYTDNPVPDGLQPLLLAYEKTPCSSCRRRCARRLESLGLIPDWMIEECLYDADSGSRELAARLKAERQ